MRACRCVARSGLDRRAPLRTMQCIGLSCVGGGAAAEGSSESSGESYARIRFSKLRASRRLRFSRSETVTDGARSEAATDGPPSADEERVRLGARSWVTKTYFEGDAASRTPSSLRKIRDCFAGVGAAVQLAKGRDDLVMQHAQGVALDYFASVDMSPAAPAVCAPRADKT